MKLNLGCSSLSCAVSQTGLQAAHTVLGWGVTWLGDPDLILWSRTFSFRSSLLLAPTRPALLICLPTFHTRLQNTQGEQEGADLF